MKTNARVSNRKFTDLSKKLNEANLYSNIIYHFLALSTVDGSEEGSTLQWTFVANGFCEKELKLFRLLIVP